jgi:RNA polymerase sigma factor (sigma-70 family)
VNPPAWFVETFEREYGGLVALATLMTGSGATAEDVVQDAFAALLGHPEVLEPGAYVRRSVVNGSVGRLRRLGREVPEGDRRPVVAPDPTRGVVDALVLRSALDTLPARQRAAILMRVTMGWSERETADALGCEPGTVGSLLHRGLATLRSLVPTMDSEDDAPRRAVAGSTIGQEDHR